MSLERSKLWGDLCERLMMRVGGDLIDHLANLGELDHPLLFDLVDSLMGRYKVIA